MALTLQAGENSNVLSTTLHRRSGDAIEAGTVEFVTIKDSGGSNVPGLTFPLALTHISGGVWEVALPWDSGFEVGNYIGDFRVHLAGDVRLRADVNIKAVDRVAA